MADVTEADIRRIVREEINAASPNIIARTIASITDNIRRGGFGYRSYARRPNGDIEENTFTQ